MSNIYWIILLVVIFFLGLILGFVIHMLARRLHNYDGIINVTRTDEKLIYSLELHEDPEALEFMDEVIFKVAKSDQSFVRMMNMHYNETLPKENYVQEIGTEVSVDARE